MFNIPTRKKRKKGKKLILGYIFAAKQIAYEDKVFMKLARQKNIELVMFNMFKKFDENEFEHKIKKCDLVYNNTAEDFVIESVKTVEELGKKVIENSRLFYYIEDKWMFYLKCKEYGIPTPETILLSKNLNIARAELKEFGKWPVVLKRVQGCQGEFVEKADSLDDALHIIRRFWQRDCDKLPIIAQEYVPSLSYRVMVIDRKVAQTVIKNGRSWKHTGVYGKKFEKFRVDKKLKRILTKVINATRINICGIDLMKKDDNWLVLEVNTGPALDFRDEEHEKMIGLVLDFLKRYYRKWKSAKNKSKNKAITMNKTF